MLMTHGRFALRGVLASAILGLATSAATAQVINTYDVKFTENPPTIDGVVSPGEWDDAVAAQGGWHLLRDTSRVDNQNSRWQAVWDDDAMYVLFQSDYGNWSPGPSSGSINFNDDNLNLYFDPNTDNEPNVLVDVGPDGYQFAFNQYMGASSIENTVPTNTGIFVEAHEDTGFGNQGNWLGLLDTKMMQNMTATGGVTEIKMTWVDFDADDPELPENTTVNGLYHKFAPQPDDTWYFKISRITSDPNNFLPDWNPTASQSFTDRPHGEITFVKDGGPVGTAGDTDGDGDVDLDDLNGVRNNFGAAGADDGSLDGDAFPFDGTVDLDDLNGVRNNFGTTSPVPEPSTWMLLASGGLAFLATKRRLR